MKMNYNIDFDKLNFKKDKNGYYFITPLLLKRSNDYLTIHCEICDDEVFLSDRSQLLSEYDTPNIDLEYLSKKINSLTKKLNLINNHMCLTKKVQGLDILHALSELIKGIIIIEHEIEKL